MAIEDIDPEGGESELLDTLQQVCSIVFKLRNTITGSYGACPGLIKDFPQAVDRKIDQIISRRAEADKGEGKKEAILDQILEMLSE